MDITSILVTIVGMAGVLVGWLFFELRRARQLLAKGIADISSLSPQQAMEILEQVAGAAVLAAQQIYAANEGEQKMDFARQYVVDFLEEFGITLDVGLVVGAIEAAIYQAKLEYGEDWDKAQ